MKRSDCSLSLVKLAFVIIAWALMASPAQAIDARYVGTWSQGAGRCEFDEVFRLTRQGTEGHEFACKVTRSRRQESGWSVSLSCSGEGEKYTRNVHWRLLQNGRLRETSGGMVRDYMRCLSVKGPQSPPLKETPFGRVTSQEFAARCIGCLTEAQTLGRSVGGFCPVDCVDVFSKMICDNQGRCRAGQ